MNYTLQAACSNDRAVHAALALESFLDLDYVNIIQHFREASHVQEKYDAASYVG